MRTLTIKETRCIELIALSTYSNEIITNSLAPRNYGLTLEKEKEINLIR